MSIIARFGTAIRKRDWGTAVIDVVVVAIGILMALGVDNWKADREARAREYEILHRMHKQVAHVEPMMKEELEGYSMIHDLLSSARMLLLDSTSEKTLSEMQCFTLLRSNQLDTADWRIPAFEELISSGNLSVVSDQEIRRAALDYSYFRELQQLKAGRASSQVVSLAYEFPELLQIKLVPTDDPDDEDGVWPYGICDTEGIRKSHQFVAGLNDNLQHAIWNLRYSRETMSALTSLHELLDDRLGITHP